MTDAASVSKPARVLIVAAPFYRTIADMLISGARTRLEADRVAVDVVEVPGALEVAPAIRIAAASGRYDGYVALGCVIRGETTHYETVCEESARGITQLGLDHALAVGNGILTCETDAQAEDRADPARKDKGAGAAEACLALIALKRRFGGDAGVGGAFLPDDTHIHIA